MAVSFLGPTSPRTVRLVGLRARPHTLVDLEILGHPAELLHPLHDLVVDGSLLLRVTHRDDEREVLGLG